MEISSLIRKVSLNARLLCIFALLSLSLNSSAQESIDLSGKWQFSIDRSTEGKRPSKYHETINLPGSMLTNGKGDDASLETQWVSSLYDSSYFFNPKMSPYRQPGNMKFPFFLTPDKHYVGNAWYRRNVFVPTDWKGKGITLYLERPHIETYVYINGKFVGHQMSLSVPHQFDVSDFIKFGKEDFGKDY